MGQIEVYMLLEAEKKPLCRAEISIKLNESPTKVSKILAKLLEHEEIRVKEIDRKEAKIKYNSLRRMRVYYI